MPGTIVPNLEDISLCEAVGSWSGSPTPALQDPLLFDSRQGTYCLQSYSAGAAARNARWNFGTGKQFGEKFLYFWFAFSMKNYTTGTGTITIRLTDTSNRNREWDIFNKTTLPHIGWIGWCIHADYGYDRQDSGFDVNAVQYAGWLLADSAKGKVYIYWDAWRFGTGLSIKSGTSGDPAKFEDFYDNAADVDEVTMAWGVVDKIAGVYFVKGKIGIGSMTINESTYFKDLNQLVVFQDIKGTPQGVYEIKGQRYDGGTGTTKIFLGENGISGCVIKASLAMKFLVTMTDSGVTEFGFHGCNLLNANTISLPPSNPNKIVKNCNFISGAEIIADTCTITGCNIISAIGRGIKISNPSHGFSNSKVISCPDGVRFSVADTYGLSNVIFSDNGYDLENTATGGVTVNATGTSDPTTKHENPGTITIVMAKALTLKGLPNNTEVSIVRVSDRYVMFHVENSSGNVVYEYGASEVGVVVDILAIHLDYDPHIGQIFDYTLPSVNTELPIGLVIDPTYYNP